MHRLVICLLTLVLLVLAANPLPSQAAMNPVTTAGDSIASLPDPAGRNSRQALENVANSLYAALAAKQDLKPYISGIMTAFQVPQLGAEDADLATNRLQKGLPLFFKPQVAEMADAFNDGGLITLDSFIAAANNQGAKQRGTHSPLTREYLTLKFAAFASKSQYTGTQVLPAFVVALGQARARTFPPASPDALWGDDLLDPLQVTLLLYATSYAGPDARPVARTSLLPVSFRVSPLSAPLRGDPMLPEPITDWIKDQVQGEVEGQVSEAIEIPLDKVEAAQASVCGSLLLFGHKMKVTATPNLVYHKDGTKPWSTRVDVQLTFQDDYWSNYLPIDRWFLQTFTKCELPHRGPVAGKTLDWSVSSGLRGHGHFDVAYLHTDDDGKASANWQTVAETTPLSQRTFYNQRDAVGAIIVRAGNLMPVWGGLERIVNQLRDTGGVGNAPLTVMYYKQPAYLVDTSFGLDSKVPLSGVVCALDKPFTLKAEGNNPGAGPHVGQFAFTPNGASGGSWTYSAKSCTTRDCGTVSASGTYQLQGAQETKPVIIMNPAAFTAVIAGGSGTWPSPTWQFDLNPLAKSCDEQ